MIMTDQNARIYLLLPIEPEEMTVSTRSTVKRARALADFEYENPTQKKTEAERLREGARFVRERKWSHRKAAEKAGVIRSTLSRYIGLELCLFIDR